MIFLKPWKALNKEFSMNRMYAFLFFLIASLPCPASNTAMQQPVDSIAPPSHIEQDLNTFALMTAQDLSKNDTSNLNLTNKSGVDLTVYGVYLYGVAFITPGLDCINGIVATPNNTTQNFMSGGATPIEIKNGQSIAIGQNYLYNMIYNWIYFDTSFGGQPGCLLPGCTWTNETPHNWCFKLGAISPNAPYTYTADTASNAMVVPFSWAPNSLDVIGIPNYAYDLIPSAGDAYVWLGPFTCDDQTLTCTTPTPQYQPFP